jgi:hypothetical protein
LVSKPVTIYNKNLWIVFTMCGHVKAFTHNIPNGKMNKPQLLFNSQIITTIELDLHVFMIKHLENSLVYLKAPYIHDYPSQKRRDIMPYGLVVSFIIK